MRGKAVNSKILPILPPSEGYICKGLCPEHPAHGPHHENRPLQPGEEEKRRLDPSPFPRGAGGVMQVASMQASPREFMLRVKRIPSNVCCILR